MPKRPTPLVQPVFQQPGFNEGQVTPDPHGFHIPHPSDAQLYQQLGDALRKDAVAFDPARGKPDDLYALAAAYGPTGPAVVQSIAQAGQLVFHAVGDTGASNAGRYQRELSVADQMTAECHTAAPSARPAFLFNLGDVVYDFGESRYYYDQFYEPYRNYPGPIFAIPGNHDSFIVPGTPAAAQPLAIFIRNFCAQQFETTPEAASLHRTAMTQPGVYFTLDAPFVRIIGLFSNALEDPGLISSENGHWPTVPDVQLAFLTAQLTRIKQEKYAGAVLLATHHPAFAYAPPSSAAGGGNHGGSPAMLGQIDQICSNLGVYPHAFLSGHAHNYQRYTRSVKLAGKTMSVPFLVSGSGGHNVVPLVKSGADPAPGMAVNYMDANPAIPALGLVLAGFDDRNFGCLRVTVDKQRLGIAFIPAGQTTPGDQVAIDLASRQLITS